MDAFLKRSMTPRRSGKTYELGGPEVLTYKEMVGVLMGVTGTHRPMLPMPSGLLQPAAFIFDKLLPKPPGHTGATEDAQTRQ